jgi:hypothetical protein
MVHLTCVKYGSSHSSSVDAFLRRSNYPRFVCSSLPVPEKRVLSVRRVMMDHYSVVVEIEQKRVLFVHFISHIILMLNAEVK